MLDENLFLRELISKDIEIEGSSVILNAYDNIEGLISCVGRKENLDKLQHDFNEDKQKYQFFKNNNVIFLSVLFMVRKCEVEKCKNLSQIMQRNNEVSEFGEIDFFSWKDKCFYSLEDVGFDKVIYDQLIEKTICIKADGSRELGFSALCPSFFNELNKNTSHFYKSEQLGVLYTEWLEYFKQLFSLYAIADKLTIVNTGNDVVYEFEIFREEGNISKRISFLNKEELITQQYYKMYQWIISDNDSEKEKINFKLRRTVVKNAIKVKETFDLDQNVEDMLDSILNRILTQKTDNFFVQYEKLKDEYINAQKIEASQKERFLLGLLGLITTISVGYYGTIINDDNFNHFAPNQAIKMMWFFATIAVLFYGVVSVIQYADYKNHIEKLKKIYSRTFLFSEKDIDNCIGTPKLFLKSDLKYLVIYILSLGICISFTMYYSYWWPLGKFVWFEAVLLLLMCTGVIVIKLNENK